MTKKRKLVKSLGEFPDFDKLDYEQEAEWWETHDLSGIWDKLEDVELVIEPGAFKAPKRIKQLSSVVNVRLDPEDHKKLRVIANQIGLGTTTLARVWILEKLLKLERSSSKRKSL